MHLYAKVTNDMSKMYADVLYESALFLSIGAGCSRLIITVMIPMIFSYDQLFD